MREIVIGRILEYMLMFKDLSNELDISPNELRNLSNLELVDMLEEINEILLRN